MAANTSIPSSSPPFPSPLADKREERTEATQDSEVDETASNSTMTSAVNSPAPSHGCAVCVCICAHVCGVCVCGVCVCVCVCARASSYFSKNVHACGMFGTWQYPLPLPPPTLRLPHSEMGPDQLQSYKAWKRAIMLVWRQIAQHKYANLFLQPVKDEEATGYSEVVHR